MNNKIVLALFILLVSLTFVFASSCNSNQDCNDGNLYTQDICINPGTNYSSCSHTPINCINNNDCNFTGFFGSEFCQGNFIFKTYKTSICINPGTIQSYCNVTDTPKQIIDCGNNSCDDFTNNYCSGNSVYHARWCYTRSCSSGSCLVNQYKDEQLVQSCQGICSNNQCDTNYTNMNNTGTINSTSNQTYTNSTYPSTNCTIDSDCGATSYKLICNDFDVENVTINPICSNNQCQNQTSMSLLRTCKYHCSEGVCTSNNRDSEKRQQESEPDYIYQYNTNYTFPESLNMTETNPNQIIIDQQSSTSTTDLNTSILIIITLILVLILAILFAIVLLRKR